MSGIYGVSDIVIGDIHPDRIKMIKQVAQSLGHSRERIHSTIFPEDIDDSRVARARRRMSEQTASLLAEKRPTMVIMPSAVALDHRMFVDIDRVVQDHSSRIRLIMATCRSAHSVRNALHADPEMERFVGAYHHVLMPMWPTASQLQIGQEVERLKASLSSIPKLVRTNQGTRQAA